MNFTKNCDIDSTEIIDESGGMTSLYMQIVSPELW